MRFENIQEDINDTSSRDIGLSRSYNTVSRVNVSMSNIASNFADKNISHTEKETI